MYPPVTQFETRKIQLETKLAAVAARRAARASRPSTPTWSLRLRQRLAQRTATCEEAP
jgi:hypothetical protein